MGPPRSLPPGSSTHCSAPTLCSAPDHRVPATAPVPPRASPRGPSPLSASSSPLVFSIPPPYLSSPQPLLFLFLLTSLTYLSSRLSPHLCFLFPDTSVLLLPPGRRLLPVHTLLVLACSSPLSPQFLSPCLMLGTVLAAGQSEVDATQNPAPGTS